tara:strand:- start:10 stop:279 length:270 start_codon:yes stop_codon:yes gene_type:complete
MSLPQLTGHKYTYVGSMDIVDTDQKYIKELERTVESFYDYWNYSTYEWKEVLWPEITALRLKNRRLEAEVALYKKAIEKAKRMTNQDMC